MSNPVALFITEEYLKESSIINGNADMKVITPTLFLVQDIYIHPILGTRLYNEVLGQVQNNTLTSDNTVLVNDYILKTMLWYTLMECTPVFKYRYMNKGVMVKSSENSQPADLDEIQFLMDKWRNNAEVYAERLTRFLKKNVALYPNYVLNPNYDEIKPNKTNFTSGLYLPPTQNTDQDDYNILIGNY